jgi:CTP synthase (UTP-ammonia lyase)
MRLSRIGIIGDYHPGVRSHNALAAAIASAARQLGGGVETSWVITTSLDQDPRRFLSQFNGLWCVPGSPCKNQEGTVAAIRFARETSLLLLTQGALFNI